ncbi:MAG: M23 family metallopeptidase [Gammaproteobacteria bacterium]|nr:M23 family metallopeptidase [Gammaproteobacteria bacterium]
MWFAVLIQIVVPTILLLVIAVQRQSSHVRWLVTCLSFGMVIAYLLLTARWDISSVYLRIVIPIAFVAAAVAGYKRVTNADAGGRFQAAVYWLVSLSLIVAMSGYLWFSLRGYLLPDEALDLQPPLTESFIVLNGGDSPFTNAHFRVRPQNFALDIVGINAFGNRAALFGDSRDLQSYVIYGAPVISPCDGKISVVVNDRPDLIPPARDTEGPAGNHVLIECRGIEVLLAHMQHGSVAVAVNDTVTTGDLIGMVGNSGNTTEPHLHIHAEKPGQPGVILDGQAVPITIGGRFLVRNSVFRLD